MTKPIILPYKGIMPKIADDAFIAPGAVIIGDVEIGSLSNIWFGCVIRGDVNKICIGERTNIQDGTVIHVTRPELAEPMGMSGATIIGSGITIGHSVLLHACTLEDDCFVGMHGTVMDGAVVQSGGMVAACANVTYKKIIQTGELWAGNPAKLLRPMKQGEIDFIPESAQNYVDLAVEYQ